MTHKVMTMDEWIEEFEPIKNPNDENASWDGTLFETYGDDHHSVNTAIDSGGKARHIWTLLDVDGELIVSEGYHIVNRFGHFITEKPYEDGVTYEVKDND